MKITIVTVSFNAHECIRKTMESVLGQDFPGLEYIVIDGGSTDGTDKIILEYSDRLAYWCSEKDGGIYFGMNKGIAAASGDYILFMNADDVFADNTVLSDVAAFAGEHPEADVIYGNSEQVLEYGTYTVHHDCTGLTRTMAISHQATFVRTALLRTHPFDTRYRYAADYEQLSSLYLEGNRFIHFDRIVSRVEMRGGTTFRNYLNSADELYSIIEARGVDIKNEKRKMIRHKKMVRAFKSCIPGFIRTPVLRFIARHYKAL